MLELLKLKVVGHILIKDVETGDVILDAFNDVHPQNMALAMAQSIANDSTGIIYSLAFGNGGTFYNMSNVLNYRSPNVVGTDAALHNQTYEVQVDEQDAGTPTTNSVVAVANPSPAITSTVVVTAYLGGSEPVDQAAADNTTTDPESSYVFDEIGLKTSSGLLLTHKIFSPVEKTANRSFLITYTLSVSVS